MMGLKGKIKRNLYMQSCQKDDNIVKKINVQILPI